jgi:sigma-E factor negative regulatory protein RseA
MNAAEESSNVNRPHMAIPLPSAMADPSANGADSVWSALVDGCVHPHEFDALMAQSAGTESLDRWATYQLVGDALRGDVPLVPATPSAVFLSRFQARLQADEASGAWQELAPARVLEPSPETVHRSAPPAANDASFRWKMIAMAASVSAVMAVSWTVLGMGSDVSGGGAGPALAQSQPAVASEAAVAVPPVEAPVIVSTGQGPLIRDARLEALLAEHRQYGGMSALQKPAGFLRNATYDAPDR